MSNEDEELEKYNYCASKNERYKYVLKLGRGSFGMVLKAWDAEKNEFVAVKIMRYEGFIVKDSTQQKKEVEILTQLKHENIVRIKDHFEYREWFLVSGIAIVMELCSQGSLSEVLKEIMKRNESIPEEKRFKWYTQLLSALVHIHSKHIAHRDIKPENILVDAKGRLKIGDVGISKVLYSEESLSECSSTLYMKTLIGTYFFMAPEVFGNHYTVKSDIFSMGLVMFVICGLPDDLIPRVKEDIIRKSLQEKDIPLGFFYHHCGDIVMATDALFTRKTLENEEKNILEKMLSSKYNNRWDSTQVLSKLEEVVRKREEKWRIQTIERSQQENKDNWCTKLLLLVCVVCVILAAISFFIKH